MSALKEWVIQLRYPYTAGVIAIMWIGSALLIMARSDLSVTWMVAMVSAATVLIASVGFSSRR